MLALRNPKHNDVLRNPQTHQTGEEQTLFLLLFHKPKMHISVEAGGSFFPTKACYVFDEEIGLSALKIVIGF